MRVRDEKAERALNEKENVWKETNEDLLTKVEWLSKEKVEKEEEHALEIEEVISELKSSALEVWEAKIKPMEDVENTGS